VQAREAFAGEASRRSFRPSLLEELHVDASMVTWVEILVTGTPGLAPNTIHNAVPPAAIHSLTRYPAPTYDADLSLSVVWPKCLVCVSLVSTTVLSDDGTAFWKMEDVAQAHKKHETLQQYSTHSSPHSLFCHRPILLYFTTLSTSYSTPHTARSPTKPIMSSASPKKYQSAPMYVAFLCPVVLFL
jgi:hypothetical protein